MIDRFIYKCCGLLDRYTEWMNNFISHQDVNVKERKRNEIYISNKFMFVCKQSMFTSSRSKR